MFDERLVWRSGGGWGGWVPVDQLPTYGCAKIGTIIHSLKGPIFSVFLMLSNSNAGKVNAGKVKM